MISQNLGLTEALQPVARPVGRTVVRRLMEHRMSIRVPVALPVSLSYARNGDAPWRLYATTSNLSFDGALIVAGDDAPQRGTLVRVELPCGRGEPLAMDALVLRRDSRELGLMFAHYSEAVFERLAALLEPELARRYGGRGR